MSSRPDLSSTGRTGSPCRWSTRPSRIAIRPCSPLPPLKTAGRSSGSIRRMPPLEVMYSSRPGGGARAPFPRMAATERGPPMWLAEDMHRRGEASEGTLPKATRRARKRVRSPHRAGGGSVASSNVAKFQLGIGRGY